VTLEERLARLEAIIAARDAEIERLRARVEELERKLGENSQNSNKPPSSDSPADRQARKKAAGGGRKPGGQPGHEPHNRKVLPPERVTRTKHCFPKNCRRCERRLPKAVDANAHLHQVIDLPSDIQPDVTNYYLHSVGCECGETTCAVLPLGIPRGMLGPRLLALVGVLIAACHVSRRKVQALLSDVLSVEVSLGALSQSEQTINDAVAPAVEEARLHALAAGVKHVDATTWYRRHTLESLWTLATKAVTVFTIATDATKETLKSWLKRRCGFMVSDRGKQFGFWVMNRRQICWAHLIRKFKAYAGRSGEAGKIGRGLLLGARTIIHSYHRIRDGTSTWREFREQNILVQAMIEALLERGAQLRSIGGSCRDILAHRAALWTFIQHPSVSPTNNHAERELRNFVLWRKCSLGSQSERGDHFAANLKSVIHTCRKQRRHVLDYLTRAIQAALHERSAPTLLAPTR
jgi:transposase